MAEDGTTSEVGEDASAVEDIRVAIVASGRGLAQARVLAESVRRVRPDWPITALVLPSEFPLVAQPEEPFSSLTLDELGDSALARRVSATPYDHQQRIAAPALIESLLDRGAHAVVFLAADSLVLGDLAELEALIQEHAAIVLPRLTGHLPDDGERPDERDLRAAGDVDDGFIAVRSSPLGRQILQVWAEMTPTASGDSGTTGIGDLDGLRNMGAGAIEDPAYGVSVWNLHERIVEQNAEGHLTVDGTPVRLFRFPGFQIDRPFWIADFSTRIVALGDPILEPFCEGYAEDVRAAGWLEDGSSADSTTGSVRWLGNGLRYDARLRRLHQAARVTGEDFGDVSSRAGAEALARWLLEPARFGTANGITRYAYDVWLARPDVGAAYPDLDDPETANGFVGWLWVYGREEMELQERLLPTRPDWVPRTPADAPNVLVTGYLRGVVGLGAAARGYAEALETAGIQLQTNTLATDPPETVTATARLREDEVEFADRVLPEGESPDVHLFCVNADQTESTLTRIPPEQRPAYTIGLWAWETDVIPKRWERAFPYVDEIWTYSSWIAENISPFSPVPVVALPIPVRTPDPAGVGLPFELPDTFRFLFNFDFFSTTARKNPVGLVQAFTQAFAHNEGPALIIKTINGTLRPAERALVQKAASGRDDVVIIDGVITDQQLAALFHACDCYVSLHRAEGFGMTIAEAMALAKPVIATGWSGNMDFTSPENAYLVDYALRPIGTENPPYDPHGTWAEPSVEHAAALMRQVWRNQPAARTRGERGQTDVLAQLSRQSVGERARDRLQRIAALTRTMAAAEADLPSVDWTDLTSQLAEHAHGRLTRPGTLGRAQRGTARALAPLRPYLSPSGGLDDTVVRAITELVAEVQELRKLEARSQARIRHLEYRLNRGV